MIKVKPEDIDNNAASNPEGYKDDVESSASGVDDDGNWLIEDEEFYRLRRKYMPYRTQKHSKSSRGLGDTIAKFAEKTGLDKLAKRYEAKTGKPCGCKRRRDKMNQKYPYKGAKDG